MRAPSMFAGLMRLATRAGFKLDDTGTPVETDRDDEPVNDGSAEDEAPAGDTPAGDAPAGDTPAGDTPGDDAGGDDGDGDDEDTSDTGAGGDALGGGGTEARGDAPRRSADFLAGQRHGATQTAGRWAAVLSSPIARGNLEMATDLLASSDMSPRAIVEHCDRYKGESSAKRMLDQTPRHNLGNGGGSVDTDAAASARAKSVAAVNAQTRKAGVQVRGSRRKPAAGK